MTERDRLAAELDALRKVRDAAERWAKADYAVDEWVIGMRDDDPNIELTLAREALRAIFRAALADTPGEPE